MKSSATFTPVQYPNTQPKTFSLYLLIGNIDSICLFNLRDMLMSSTEIQQDVEIEDFQCVEFIVTVDGDDTESGSLVKAIPL